MKLLAPLCFCFFAVCAQGEVFFAQDEALQLAFPGSEQITQRSFILTAPQKKQLERRAGVKLDSSLLTLFVGLKENRPLGFALIETVEVRSMPATIMTVIGTDHAIRKTVVLAFHEPPEYLPPPNWLKELENKSLHNGIAPGRGVPPIAGSTLSAEAVARSARKALAAVDILMEK